MNRLDELLKYLLHQEGYTTLEALAARFHVSSATIRNDLRALEQELNRQQIQINKKRGMGVALELSPQQRSRLLADLQTVNDSLPFSKQNSDTKRLYPILLCLLQANQTFITTEKLAEQLHVGRTTLQNDLSALRQTLSGSSLTLEIRKNRGIRLLGEEKALRRLYARIFHTDRKSIPEMILRHIHLNPEPIDHALKRLEETTACQFTEEAFQILILHVAIAVHRLMENKAIEWNGEKKIDAKYQKEWKGVQRLWDDLESHYHIQAGMGERYLLFQYVISSSVLYQEPAASQETPALYIAKAIITLVENMKQVSIPSETYIPNLIIHLQPLLNRIQNQISIRNPMLEEIKQEYADAFGLAFMTNTIFERYCHTHLSEDEIGYIAIHIQLMLEDREQTLRILIVCNNGIGIAQLLSSRLSKHFSQLCVADTMGKDEFYACQKRDDIDFVLSTVPLQSPYPLLMIHPLLPDADIAAIADYINSRSLRHQALSALLDTFLFVHPPLSTQEEIVRFAQRKLLREESVTEGFADAIYKREQASSTAIGNGTAIPHASFETVKRSAICVITLRDPVCWGNEDCDLIVFIALTRLDSLRFKKKLRFLFYQLYDADIHRRIIQADTKETVSHLLKL